MYMEDFDLNAGSPRRSNKTVPSLYKLSVLLGRLERPPIDRAGKEHVHAPILRFTWFCE